MLNMFRILIHPSSGTCDLFVELFHGLCCSGLMCVGVTLWFGWGGVVSVCRLKLKQISRKFLRMDVLTSETCWALNKEIIKQVTSSWSLFTQPNLMLILFHFQSYHFLRRFPDLNSAFIFPLPGYHNTIQSCSLKKILTGDQESWLQVQSLPPRLPSHHSLHPFWWEHSEKIPFHKNEAQLCIPCWECCSILFTCAHL